MNSCEIRVIEMIKMHLNIYVMGLRPIEIF